MLLCLNTQYLSLSSGSESKLSNWRCCVALPLAIKGHGVDVQICVAVGFGSRNIYWKIIEVISNSIRFWCVKGAFFGLQTYSKLKVS